MASPAAVHRALGCFAVCDQGLARKSPLLDVAVTRDAVGGDGKSVPAWVADNQALEAWDLVEKAWRAGVRESRVGPLRGRAGRRTIQAGTLYRGTFGA